MNKKPVTSGYYSLDLLATFRIDSDIVVLDRLKTPADLDNWLKFQDFNPPSKSTAVDLDRCKVLRKAVFNVVKTCLSNGPAAAEDLNLINKWASGFRMFARLTGPGEGIQEPADVSECLAAVAFEAVELLGGKQAKKIRKCSREFCDRFFVDRSRSHPRQWCDMEVCGNRSKVNAFRIRKGLKSQ